MNWRPSNDFVECGVQIFDMYRIFHFEIRTHIAWFFDSCWADNASTFKLCFSIIILSIVVYICLYVAQKIIHIANDDKLAKNNQIKQNKSVGLMDHTNLHRTSCVFFGWMLFLVLLELYFFPVFCRNHSHFFPNHSSTAIVEI